MEIWKPIPWLNGKYHVSSFGRVKSLTRIIIYKNGAVHIHKGRILKLCNNGYGYFVISVGGGKISFVHKLVAGVFIKNPNDYKIVNHKDGDKKNNRPENLEWCTRQHNEHHAKINGLKHRAIGEKNGMAILKERDIINIRKMILNNTMQSKIAAKYNVSRALITLIKQKKLWGYLQ